MDEIAAFDRAFDFAFPADLWLAAGAPFGLGEVHAIDRAKAEHEGFTDDLIGAELFEQAERSFTGLGWAHYEVSNYAAPGEESRHNLHYWRGGAYVGLGAAAVGCLDEGPGRALRWRNDPNPQR
ncbi:MAG: hypothetical protein WCB63_09515, partial [Polyangiales bacterium]